MKTHCLRLHPHADLKKEITKFCIANELKSGCILSAVGSLECLRLRLASSKSELVKTENFEVLSLNGTISIDGVHLHLSVADANGDAWGGHLLDGNLIFTTCEIVILEITDVLMSREFDPQTGFKELKLNPL